jgi:hypothetical protein|tara:strand:+ start:1929 stop:2081 length:153 start_codon:yes stop_codon:yes gene_type:complete
MEDSIQSNTCEIIKIDKKTINDIKNLKEQFLAKKEKIKNEIINDLQQMKE